MTRPQTIWLRLRRPYAFRHRVFSGAGNAFRRMPTGLRSGFVHIPVIILVASLVYSNTFTVPFQFDDQLNIVDNPTIKDLAICWPPSGARWFGYLSFAINYRISGLDTASYHVVNLAIHILNALFVYWIILLTFRTPYFASPGKTIAGLRNTNFIFVALFSSLLFAVHPVQTQAVTYIVQRFASLATFFCLLALITYAWARLLSAHPQGGGSGDAGSKIISRWSLYSCSVLAAVLAMETKQNAFPLPIAIALYEVSFFGVADPARRIPFMNRVAHLLPFVLASLIAPLTMTGSASNTKDALGVFTAASDISRHDYLLTQFRVIVTYVRLLFVPVSQSIDYDFPVYHNLLEAAVSLSCLFLASLLGLGCYLYFRSRQPARPARLIAFGIFWFFIMLSVESSVVPIADLIAEHRMYLPSVGAFIAIATAAVATSDSVLRRHRQGPAISIALAAIIVAVLSVATFVRNSVWRTETSLWEDAARTHPGAARPHLMLGTIYGDSGRRTEEIAAYRKAIALKPSYSEAHVNLGSAYLRDGKLDEAMDEFVAASRLGRMDEIDTAILFANIGSYYQKKGRPDRELEYYNYALGLTPGDARLYFLIGAAYSEKGMPDKASEYFSRAHQMNPDRF